MRQKVKLLISLSIDENQQDARVTVGRNADGSPVVLTAQNGLAVIEVETDEEPAAEQPAEKPAE